MFERDADDMTAMHEPVLYQAGQRKVYFNFKIFWKWIAMSIIHGGASYYITIYVSLFQYSFL